MSGLQVHLKKENLMKTVLATATFLIIGTPVFAQSHDPDLGTGNVASSVINQAGENAYAQAPRNYENRVTYRQMPRRKRSSTYQTDPKMIPNGKNND